MARFAYTRTKATLESTSVRTGSSVDEMKQATFDNPVCIQEPFAPTATRNDQCFAGAYTVRDRPLFQWAKTTHAYYEKENRTVRCLSA